MVSTRMIALLSAFAAAVSAAPAPIVAEQDPALNITETLDRNLRNGEMVVFGKGGKTAIITQDTWNLLLKVEGVEAETPEIDHDYLKAGEGLAEIPVNHTDLALGKRDCNANYQFVVDKQMRFVDWDVQMSPVVIGAGSKGIDITISKSYAISNGVTAGGSFDMSKLIEKLGLTFKVDYSRTWTTTQGYLIRGTVDPGYTGVVITRPWTNRKYGRTFQGCVGALKQTGTFMADSHEDGSYEGVTWVGGAITACIKQQSSIPLSRCNGSGNFR
ncbi:hypothetical protein K4K59_001162 [Colletotrichum sp. SAR11_240]|nr:hypothetical protein K4K59_001162 [Colletotrichum sp. SAR11_240]